jgi:peptidoglycan/LPS O-acetylase OafA/YrhL
VSATPPSKYLPSLDGLRALAILLVIPHNSDTFSHTSALLKPAAILAHAGWIGVQLFFVLSGFLITRNLLNSRTSSNYFRVFYERRVLRIFPLYFLTLFVAFVVLPHTVTLSKAFLDSTHNQGWLWSFLSNWAQPFGHSVMGFSHFWSLAVEEQFYLVWPLLVLWSDDRRLIWACIAVAVVALAIRLVLLAFSARPEILYEFTVCRMDALAIGAAAAVLSRSARLDHWLQKHRNAAFMYCLAALAGAALISNVFAIYSAATFTIGHPALALAFALAVLNLASIDSHRESHWLARILSYGWVRSIGRYSFAMYVFHLPLELALGSRLEHLLDFTGSARPLLFSTTLIVISYCAGWASYHLIEKHFLRLKSRVVPRSVLQTADA